MSIEQLPIQAPGSEREKIGVIGSGIAGSLVAHDLALQGYRVTVLEERPEPFSGASANAAHAHLGGLYSGSAQTAQECLASAIEIKKTMPYALTNQRTAFLVAEQSAMPFEDFTAFYAGLRDHYGTLPAEDQVFGRPESFFRVLEPGEYAFAKNVAGGIMTQEVNLDMARARRTLMGRLHELGVTMLTGTKVTGVDMRRDQFRLTVKDNIGRGRMNFDQVVNAGGYKARLLDHQLGDRTPYNLFLKTWNVVRNNGKPLPPFFIVRGDFMMHVPLTGDRQGLSVMNGTDSGSYIDNLQYTVDSPAVPEEWEEILRSGVIADASERQAAILEYAGDNFLKEVGNFEPVQLIPGVATSFSSSRQDRTQRGARIVQPGWQTIVPTKATHGLELAREAVANVLHRSHRSEVA